jgi:uncharacterized protein YbjT (DUF2867 family)
MKQENTTILAVGAAGKFAGLVLPALARRGAKVRGLVRRASDADEVRAHGATDVAVGDLADSASVDAALEGIHSVFYIAPAFLPDEANIGKRIVEAAQRAGVRRFVFSSVIHPTLASLENHAAKGPVEAAILASDMEYTFLHPTLFFQNYAGTWQTVLKTGVLAEPWSTETRFSRVDYRDVAEVAAIALTEDRLTFGTFELCAEGNMNRKEVATLIGDVLGRPIDAAKVQLDASRATPGDSPEARQMAAMKPMFEWYDRHGLLGSALTLRAILGREPRTLRAYFEELAGAAGKSKGH